MSDSTMLKVSADGIGFVDEMANKVRTVPPEYAQYVLGDIHSGNFPEAENFRRWLKNYLIVHARFNGRDFNTGRPLPKGRDYRATEHEMGEIGQFAGYLIRLAANTNTIKTGVKTPVTNLVVDLNRLFSKEIIYG